MLNWSSNLVGGKIQPVVAERIHYKYFEVMLEVAFIQSFKSFEALRNWGLVTLDEIGPVVAEIIFFCVQF